MDTYWEVRNGGIKMEEVKEICDVCGDEKESTYSGNLKKYMCEECWDNYGELCHLGLA